MNAVNVIAAVRQAGFQISYQSHRGGRESFQIQEGPMEGWPVIADVFAPYIADQENYEKVLDVLYLEDRRANLRKQLEYIEHDLNLLAV